MGFLDSLGLGGPSTTDAANDAATIQTDALRRGTKLINKAQQKNMQAVSPFTQQGQTAAGVLGGYNPNALLPSNQIVLDEGQRAINRMLAASGKLRSGEGAMQMSDFIESIFSKNKNDLMQRAIGVEGLGINQLQSQNLMRSNNAQSGASLTQQAAGINAELIQQQAAAAQAQGAGLGAILGMGTGAALTGGNPAGAIVGGQLGGMVGGGIL